MGQPHPGSGTEWPDAVDRPEGKRHDTDGVTRAEGGGSTPKPSCPAPQLQGGCDLSCGHVLNTCDLYIDFLQMQEREISWHLGAK